MISFFNRKKKKTGLERTVAAVVQQQIPLKIPYQRYNLSLFTFFCQRRTNEKKAIGGGTVEVSAFDFIHDTAVYCLNN